MRATVMERETPPRAPAGRASPARRSPHARRCPWPAALALAVLSAACGSDRRPLGGGAAVEPPGAGVVFSYPADGQYDVPVGTRLLLAFSQPIHAAFDQTCTVAGGQVTGAFCVEGPEGLVQGTVTVDGASLAFAPAGRLAAGATYRVWARPALLPSATNLPTATPLVTFRTRSTRTRGGEPAAVLTVNGAPLAPDGTTALPFLDAAPVRLLFSEPLDAATVGPASVRLVHAADETAVDGVAIVHGIHLTFQPAQPLVAGDAYRLELTAAARDLGGEPIAPLSLAFTPRRTAVPGHGLYPLSLDVTPAWTDGTNQPASRIGMMPVNANMLSSQLVGSNTMGVLAGGLDALAGDPQVMGTPLPMIIRRGQRLDLTSMAIRFGGAIEAGLQTGTLHFTMLADALGFLTRNPFRGADQLPDDAEAPTFVDFTMDAVISSEDAHGNTIASQTVMGIRVLGLSSLDRDELAIDQVGAIDFDLIGVDTAPVALAMRLRTGTRAPTPELGTPLLVSSFPADGARDVSPADPIELNFSAPLDPARLRDGVEVTLTQGATAIPASARVEGATVVVVPSARLAEAGAFTLAWTRLRSLGGVDVADGAVQFTTAATSTGQAPPIVVALTPGAPCALTGGTAGAPGRCAGGLDTDARYRPFTLPANRDVRVIFSEVIDPASLTLGAACGQGSVRVERVGADGRCAGVVPGALVKRDREARFLANDPWTADAAYRVTLVAGADARCDAGEICGRNRVALDTDPLGGVSGGGGGPDLVIDFAGAPATVDTYQPLASDPVTDQNGNGYVDGAEQPNDRNRVVMEISAIGGIVTSASLPGVDCLPARAGEQACSYLHATLPNSIGGVRETCPIDAQGRPSVAPNPCVEVLVFPSAILGTSVMMNTTALGLIPINNLPTGMQVMRLREEGGPILGYIMREAGVADPQFVINQSLYFDAPDLAIPLATHDLASKPLQVTLKGPVTFRPDGRMDVALRSVADVTLTVNISALFLPGHIDLRIPAGEMRVTLAGPPLR